LKVEQSQSGTGKKEESRWKAGGGVLKAMLRKEKKRDLRGKLKKEKICKGTLIGRWERAGETEILP